MPTSLATVRGTSQQTLYPFTRSVEFLTGLYQSADGVEQRFAKRPPLYRFELPYSDLLAADITSQLSVFNSAKGQFSTNLQLTLGGTTYSNLALEDDVFETTTNQAFLYSSQIRLQQIQNGSWTPPTAPTAFPTFANGKSAQYPITQGKRFLTWKNDQATGPRYALASYGSSFTGYPSGALPYWRLSYPLMTEADLATLETFFLAAQGRYLPFSFTDPISDTTFTHCRFDSDVLEIKYLQGRTVSAPSTFGSLVSTSVSIAQTNNS